MRIIEIVETIKTEKSVAESIMNALTDESKAYIRGLNFALANAEELNYENEDTEYEKMQLEFHLQEEIDRVTEHCSSNRMYLFHSEEEYAEYIKGIQFAVELCKPAA